MKQSASCNASYNMVREELALVKQNGAWKPRRKKGWSGLFYPPNGLNFQFCWFNLIFLIAPSWSESNFILFLFFYSIRVGPSRSELIRPGLADRVDPVRLLYLPLCSCLAASPPRRKKNRLIWQQDGNVTFVTWRESARKGLNKTSGAQFAALPLVNQLFDVNWRSRSVAKSA